MGTFTLIWGRPAKSQQSTTLIRPIGKPAWKANPKDMGRYLQFCHHQKGGITLCLPSQKCPKNSR
jgi:hypothetical protein